VTFRSDDALDSILDRAQQGELEAAERRANRVDAATLQPDNRPRRGGSASGRRTRKKAANPKCRCGHRASAHEGGMGSCRYLAAVDGGCRSCTGFIAAAQKRGRKPKEAEARVTSSIRLTKRTKAAFSRVDDNLHDATARLALAIEAAPIENGLIRIIVEFPARHGTMGLQKQTRNSVTRN
jgi:hypothetical protein